MAGLAIAVCGGASFFFASAETALFTLGQWQLRDVANRHGNRGAAVKRLLASPQDCLAAIVLGNTVSTFALVAVAVWMVLHQEWPPVATLLGALGVILVFGEVLPKTLAVRRPETWALRVAHPMVLVVALAKPLLRLPGALTRYIIEPLVRKGTPTAPSSGAEEYTELLEVAFQQGTLAQTEKEILLQILNLNRRTAKDVMRPRAQVYAIPDDLPVPEMIAAARRHRHRRLPMYDENPDTIVGVLNTRVLLLDPQADLAEAIEFPSFVPESTNLLQLLRSLQRQRRGLAIVLDEYGGTAGLVSMEDILGSLIGRLPPEGEGVGFIMERLSPGRWRVNGSMRLDDFRREYPELGEVPEVDTMAGLVLLQADVVPEVGQSVVFRGLRLTTRVADERRVKEVLVEAVGRTERGGAA